MLVNSSRFFKHDSKMVNILEPAEAREFFLQNSLQKDLNLVKWLADGVMANHESLTGIAQLASR